jgi:hypothetical protein
MLLLHLYPINTLYRGKLHNTSISDALAPWIDAGACGLDFWGEESRFMISV